MWRFAAACSALLAYGPTVVAQGPARVDTAALIHVARAAGEDHWFVRVSWAGNRTIQGVAAPAGKDTLEVSTAKIPLAQIQALEKRVHSDTPILGAIGGGIVGVALGSAALEFRNSLQENQCSHCSLTYPAVGAFMGAILGSMLVGTASAPNWKQLWP